MQHARAQNILSGQSNLARRVFAAVPMQVFWNVQQISGEMHRLDAHNLSKAEITGCLRSLVDAGLVNETASLTFRSAVKPAPIKEPTVANSKKDDKPQVTLMDRLFEVADKLRSAAEGIEAIAMEVDSAIVEAGKGNENLKTLQATLRGLLNEV